MLCVNRSHRSLEIHYKMTRKIIAVLIMVGASYALHFETERKLARLTHSPSIADNVPATIGNTPLTPENVPLTPDNIPLTPEDVPLSAENVPLTPGNVPLTSNSELLNDNGHSLAEVAALLASKDGPKPEGDLKTDATFWWPSYYRSYYRYPYYSHYRPRPYYRYYYW